MCGGLAAAPADSREMLGRLSMRPDARIRASINMLRYAPRVRLPLPAIAATVRSAPMMIGLTLAVMLAGMSADSGSVYARSAYLADATSSEMSATFVRQLPQGAMLPGAEGPACPAAIASVILEGYASCFAEYQRAGGWYLADGTVQETEGALVATITHIGSWQRRWRVCRQHGWQLDGTNLFVPGASRDTLVANNDCGRQAPQTDVYFVQQEMIYGCGKGSVPNRSNCKVGAAEVGWQFVDSAGFNSIGRFRCRHRQLIYTCTNAMGDSFRYSA